jgi:hypothetical protein
MDRHVIEVSSDSDTAAPPAPKRKRAAVKSDANADVKKVPKPKQPRKKRIKNDDANDLVLRDQIDPCGEETGLPLLPDASANPLEHVVSFDVGMRTMAMCRLHGRPQKSATKRRRLKSLVNHEVGAESVVVHAPTSAPPLPYFHIDDWRYYDLGTGKAVATATERLIERLEAYDFSTIDTVLIENQPRVNAKAVGLSFVLYTYFHLMRIKTGRPRKLLLVHAKGKLTVQAPPQEQCTTTTTTTTIQTPNLATLLGLHTDVLHESDSESSSDGDSDADDSDSINNTLNEQFGDGSAKKTKGRRLAKGDKLSASQRKSKRYRDNKRYAKTVGEVILRATQPEAFCYFDPYKGEKGQKFDLWDAWMQALFYLLNSDYKGCGRC